MRVIVLSCGMGAGLLATRKSGGFVTLAWDGDRDAVAIARANFPEVEFASPVNLPAVKIPHSDVLICKGWPPEAWSVLSVFSPRVIIAEGKVKTPPGYKAWSDDLEVSKFGAPLVGKRRMTVMLREDVRTIFKNFPFPDGSPGHGMELMDVLEPGLPADGRKGYMVNVRKPCRMPRYHRGPFPMVPGEGGPRRLTTTECLKLFGFPRDYRVGANFHRVLSSSMIPPMIMEIIEELRVWVDLV